jgi:hypothetical protein
MPKDFGATGVGPEESPVAAADGSAAEAVRWKGSMDWSKVGALLLVARMGTLPDLSVLPIGGCAGIPHADPSLSVEAATGAACVPSLLSLV